MAQVHAKEHGRSGAPDAIGDSVVTRQAMSKTAPFRLLDLAKSYRILKRMLFGISFALESDRA